VCDYSKARSENCGYANKIRTQRKYCGKSNGPTIVWLKWKSGWRTSNNITVHLLISGCFTDDRWRLLPVSADFALRQTRVRLPGVAGRAVLVLIRPKGGESSPRDASRRRGGLPQMHGPSCCSAVMLTPVPATRGSRGERRLRFSRLPDGSK
jgi:hypothetical protein